MVEGIDSFFGFQFSHGAVDPLFEVVAEPRLNTIRKPDRPAVSCEELGGRRPSSTLEFSLPNPRQTPTTYEPAHRASAVKLQVTVDGSEGNVADQGQATWYDGEGRRIVAEARKC